MEGFVMSNTDNTPFRGFKRPRYTQVPDELIDDIMVDLTGAELKVLLYIIRHTFGYGKASDTISLSQMLSGIRRNDGTIVDRGTGLSKKTLLAAINTLEQRCYVLTERRRSVEKGDEPTVYRLNVDERPIVEETTPPLGEKVHQGGGGETPPGGWRKNSPTQETTIQETIKQDRYLSKIRNADAPEKKDDASPIPESILQHSSGEDGEDSRIRQTDTEDTKDDHQNRVPTTAKATDQADSSIARRVSNRDKKEHSPSAYIAPAPSRSNGFEPIGATLEQFTPLPLPSAAEAREVIEQYIRDFARELHDAAPIKSSVTRAFRLYQQSGWTLDGFISVLYEARSITKERSASIHATDNAKTLPAKRKMAYFFACLEDKLGLREQQATDARTE